MDVVRGDAVGDLSASHRHPFASQLITRPPLR